MQGYTFNLPFHSLPIEADDGRRRFSCTLQDANVAVTQMEDDKVEHHPTAPVNTHRMADRFEVVVTGETAEFKVVQTEVGPETPPILALIPGLRHEGKANSVDIDGKPQNKSDHGSWKEFFVIEKHSIRIRAEFNRENTHALVGPLGLDVAAGPVLQSVPI